MCEAVTGMDLVFLCNPNNPTGLLTPRDTIIKILHACGKAGAILIVDECFMDLTDEPEAFTAEPLLASQENLMILKAFTKTYAMAGLRLGYALCGSASIAERIAGAGPPWSVSAPAQTAGISVLKEAAYLKALREIIKKERGRLKEGLAALGAEVLGGSANYVFFRVGAPSAAGRGTSLAEAGRGASLAEVGRGTSLAEAGRGTSFAAALAARGILIRDCSNFKGLEDGTYFRAAVRLPEENDAFLQAVKKEIRASGQQKKEI
jgi:threonine-phosphate decarboxylase